MGLGRTLSVAWHKSLKPMVRGALMPLMDRRVYTNKHGLAKGLKRRGGFNFIPRPLSKEEVFLSEQDFSGQTVYDVGAYQGVLTIFFARAVGPNGQVVAFEPNPLSSERAEENVRLNGFENVQLLRVGVGKKRTTAVQAFRSNNLAQASFQEQIKESTLNQIGSTSIEIQIETLDHLVGEEGLAPPDFVKIDVEGLEDDVLLGMVQTLQRHKPRLFVELHGPGLDRIRARALRIVSLLVGLGYSVHHVENEVELTIESAEANAAGHFYCTCQ